MYLVRPYLRIVVKYGKNSHEFKYTGKPPYTGAISFVSPFAIGTKPENNKLTLYNLTKQQFGYFLSGAKVHVYGGFYNSDMTYKNGGLIAYGTVQSSSPMAIEGTDHNVEITFNHFPKITSKHIKKCKVIFKKVSAKRNKSSAKSVSEKITLYNKKKTRELDKWIVANPNASSHSIALKRASIAKSKRMYASKTRLKYNRKQKTKQAKSKKTKQIKYVNLAFKKGTTAKTVITTIAKRAKIPLGTVKLNYNHKYANGYTVTKQPLNAIQEVANNSNTPLFIRNGKLNIREITSSKKKPLVLTPETGLVSNPTPADDDNQFNGKKYEAQCLMRHDIAVGTLVKVSNGIQNYGTCVVIGGQREYTTSEATVTIQFVNLKQYKLYRKQKLNNAKNKAEKDRKKAAKDKKKDAAKRQKVKDKRKKRK